MTERKDMGVPKERHLEFEGGSLSERGDNEGVTWKEGKTIKVRAGRESVQI